MSHSQTPMPPQAALSTQAQPRITGTVLGTFPDYEPAQALVDRLADSDFEVANLSIVGKGLVSVERVVQRLSYPRVALSGATTGVVMGLIIGIGFALFLPDHNWASILPMVVIGACIWTIMNVIGYATKRGQRDFLSTSQTVATSYEVLCEPAAAAQARQILAGGAPSSSSPEDPARS
ncbi:general stress protein [Falsarthrobacter nasiphocae]|uniref:General stress protein 17M-like domain-containing protein n=1 Tax=Falsarthrobacter nasiphocae TaxID=189863 RepID=A0AAE4C5G1_9MICC|nr:general stress protein [Falsarthrobacter nasiphocae]MDR6891473.1 hypothetical protein [Falsarthrobacter nasiphocae]